MALRVSPAVPLRTFETSPFLPRVAGNVSLSGARQWSRLQVRAKESLEVDSKPLTGVVFEPFTEVQSHITKISSSTKESLARQRYRPSCEAAINDQINVEYNASYIYHALYAYFDRDNVALPGFAMYFKEASDEERGHAEAFLKYQNHRGGRVKLQAIIPPEMEFNHPEKGDALYAMELALSMEKLVNEKLLALSKVAEENEDSQLSDFVDDFLTEQVEAIRKVSGYVSQLRRIGEGHGVYHFDLELQKEGAAAVAA